MPVVKRQVGQKFAVPGRSLFKQSAYADLVLPTEFVEPSGELKDFSLLVHGEKKVGKTTLSLQGGRVLLLQFDPPQKAYRRLEIVVKEWGHFLAILKKLEEQGNRLTGMYDRIVIDGADIWFQQCQAYVCKQLGIKHPQDEDFGVAWSALRQEFSLGVDRILKLPRGVWFLCHSIWKEIKSRSGIKQERLLPRLSGMAEEILNGKVDGWFAYDFEGDERILILRADQKTGAGHRMDFEDCPHFRTTDKTHVPIQYLRAGPSAKTAYQRLEAAFNNVLPAVDLFSLETVVPSKSPVRVLVKRRSK